MRSPFVAASPVDHSLPPNRAGLVERLRRSFEQHAELTALEGRDGTLSYRELERRSAGLAATLAAAGVGPGQIVPLLMRRSAALVIAQVALLRLGAAYAPLDLTSPPARLQAMLGALKPAVMVVDTDAPAIDTEGIRCIAATSIASSVVDAPPPWHPSVPNSAAYVMFTSGTTGIPKAVLIPQSGIRRLVCDADFAEFRPHARWGFLSSPAFDASTLEVWAPLLNGGCCVVQDQTLPSLDELADFLLSRRITDTWLTAALFNALVDDRPDAFAGLRQLLVGGERVSPRHARSVLDAHAGLRLVNGYGPTENTTFTLCHPISRADTDKPTGIPIGRPIRGTAVRIGTMDDGADEGELLAGGDGVALGYLDDAELNARKFVEIDGQRWYRSGDLVRRSADGVFEFLGRVDRQVKIQGHRIELEEVELALLACPGVGNGAVLVQGEAAETRHLVACFSALEGEAPAIDAVAAFLAERLAPPAVPRVLLAIERLPVNVNGKLDRHALTALVNARQQPAPSAEPIAWHSESERLLAAIWQRCMPHAQLRRDANFLALGGTSLMALRVSAQVREQLRRDLSPIDVLRFPVLADQAQRLDHAPAFAPIEPVADDVEDRLPLTQGQQALLAASELDVTGCAYLVHVALQLDAMPDIAALQRAFETLAARHPALRLTIAASDMTRHGRVHEHLPAGWWHQHPTTTETPSDLAWPSGLHESINRPLSLARDGVMRVDLWPVVDGSCLLVWTVHHVAIDEASVDLCLSELHQLLADIPLRAVYGSPVGFASFEKAHLDHAAVGHWSGVLSQALSGTAPALTPAPGPGREAALDLPAGLTARLVERCAAWGVTPFAPLLTAFGLALQDVFGRSHRFVSTPFSRRIEPELIEPAGYLLDLCLVEAGRRDDESDAQALARVQRSVIALQRPAFLPRLALAEALMQHDPQVAQQLNSFAFTWRLAPTRRLPFGRTHARLLRVPQRGARYGLTLHAASVAGGLQCCVEALEEAFADGKVGALGDALARRLESLCELPRWVETTGAERAAPPPEANLEAILSASWRRWLGTPAEQLSPGTNFLHWGGNSLTAMRMSAQLRREHGVALDAAAFLARPTFASLCELAAAPAPSGPRDCVVVGSQAAPNVVVLIPGKGGQAVGLYQLAVHLQRDFGDNHAVVVMDLEAMLRRSPSHQPLAFLQQRLNQAMVDLGRQRIAAFVGFSLGGLLALQLAQQFAPATPPEVWLLDTYAPRTLVKSLALRIERRIGRTLSAKLLEQMADSSASHAPSNDEPEHERGEGPQLWEMIQVALARVPAVARKVEVHLVQAQQSTHHVGLLWRRRSNGFNPRHYAAWTVHHIDAMHLDLPRSMALVTSELVSAGLRRDRSQTPA